MTNSVNWTFHSLSLLVQINSYIQFSIGISSLLISIILFYVVIKSTPEELSARRANVLTQLIGCVLQSAMIFTGPMRQFGSFYCAILYVVWVANTAFTANSAMSSSVSHYLGMMEGVRQSSGLLNWYSNLSFRVKSIIITCSHIFVTLWSGISLFVSITFGESEIDRTFVHLRDDYAIIQMRQTITINILGISFGIFIVFYFFQFVYLNRKVWHQLDELKSSISPRTWTILHHTSLLSLGIAVQPIFSFFIPTCIIIILNFTFISIDSSVILNVVVWTTVALYASAPFQFYLLTLISFKVYRHHFFSILRSPLDVIYTCRTRRISISPHQDNAEAQKV